MKRQDRDVIDFTEETVKIIYSKFKANDNADPMETLMNTKGWESVAKRVSEIVADYNQKKARAQKKNPQKKTKKKIVCSNERIDSPDDDVAFDYPVPHFVIKGNPDVGKTPVARLIGQIFYETGILKKGMTIEATREDLVDRYVGGTANRTREQIIEAQESVLFIDDAYSLLDKSDENNYPKEAIDEIVAAMTNTKQYHFCMIMAGYPEPMDELLKMNSGLSSRFSKANILTIDDYPPELLKTIFVSNCKKDGYRFWGDAEGEDDPLDLDLFFKNKIQLFEDKRIRTAWDEEKEEWYFSIVDVVAVLTDSKDPAAYWRKLKQRLKEEGNETVTNCHGLKMKAADGKRRLTDVADTEQLLRIIQSIPSPKAEPFKMWLAQVGRDRIEETIDPELTIERALETYLKKGYTREWINQRLQAIQVRKELTDEWDARGVKKGVEYAILTDEISRAWSGMSTRQYKNLKGLKKENLRDNMTTLELVLNMLAEATTTEISKQREPETFAENMAVAREGGEVAGIARKAAEERTGVPVITSKNAAQLNQVVTNLIEGVVDDGPPKKE